MGPHECRAQGNNHFSCSTGHPPFDAAQGTVGLLSWNCTLLTHVGFFTNKHSQSSAALLSIHSSSCLNSSYRSVFVVFLMEAWYSPYTHTPTQRFIQFLGHFQMLKMCFPSSFYMVYCDTLLSVQVFCYPEGPFVRGVPLRAQLRVTTCMHKLFDGQKRHCCLLFVLQFGYLFSYCRKSPVLSASEVTLPSRPQTSLCSSPQKRSRLQEQVQQNKRGRERGGRHASDGQIQRARRRLSKKNPSAPFSAHSQRLRALRSGRHSGHRPTQHALASLAPSRPDLSYVTHLLTIRAIAAANGNHRERRAPLTTLFPSVDGSGMAHSPQRGGEDAAGTTASNLRLRMRSY